VLPRDRPFRPSDALATSLQYCAITPVALPLAYFSNLNAAMTHYGTGSAPVYFNAGYVRQGKWWKLGFVISLVNLAIWMGIGMVWWKIVGLW